ncbi:UvrD-helicase domain-containing protein [Actinopolymorpha sp. B11F2]|uniref:UvrD-helicase domain-containing protein n=1 Tax=Actinopolymorpha sp. B11F2 TaxID=3160862 RepID=UPI0032E52D9D
MAGAVVPKPTGEQQAAIEGFTSGGHMILEAGAGSGKTTTLKMLAGQAPSRRGVYLAFNKAVAVEAGRSFPRNVQCATAHSLAFRTVGRQFKHRLNGRRVRGRETARILGVNEPFRISDLLMLAPAQVARIAMETVTRFCYSADVEPGPQHVPAVTGVDEDAVRRELVKVVVPFARNAWADLTSVDGRLRFSHDVYLKVWQLSGPRLDVDFVLLDEAQDSNPVVVDMFNRQQNAQRVLVGDANQAIYGWRGAVDAMATFDADHHLYLSQSFRFGPAVADEANKWLGLLEATLRISGTAAISSRLAPLGQPDAVLCRTNAAAVGALLDFHEAGVPVAIVGGGWDIKRFAEAAITLKAGAGTHHPELAAFQTWGQVQDYVDNDHGGADLKVFVRLIDSHGPDTVIAAVDKAVDEGRARVTVSTAHKAKGREWSTVKIADDFTRPKDTTGELQQPSRPDQMLAYVSITRARHVLDRGGLAWVDELLAPLTGRGEGVPG